VHWTVAVEYIENRTFNEIQIGESASLLRRLTMQDIKLFAIMSGDVNPAHVDEDYAKSSSFHEIIAHGLWGGALISTVLGTQLPGPGTIYLSQSLRFKRPVGLGDALQVTVTAREKIAGKNKIIFDCQCMNQDTQVVITGEAEVIAPTEKIRRPRALLPDIWLAERTHLHQLLHAARQLPPVRAAIVHPIDDFALSTAVEAAEAKIIIPVLVGPRRKIRDAAERKGVDISKYDLIETEHSNAAAAEAVAMARRGEVEALIKGSLSLDELLAAVTAPEAGLRTERVLSHVYVFDVPTYPRAVFITDAGINAYPSLSEKRDIVQNAIDLAHALGIAEPKTAILSAVETVTSKIPSTLDAAALCKMAERKQITGGVVDGPLPFDAAISEISARAKGLTSTVAGQADILVAPDLESASLLAQQLDFLADGEGAGVLLGARVPIALPTQDNLSRLVSCAVACLMVHHRRKILSRTGDIGGS